MSLKKILIVGLQTFDAGKTTLSKALIYALKETGVEVVPFKPHSGISYWNQFDTFQTCLQNNSFVCSDIIQLANAAQSDLPLELLNPVNRLSIPFTGKVGTVSEDIRVFQEFIAERFTLHTMQTQENIYFVKDTVKKSRMRDLKQFYKRVKKTADKIFYVKKFNDIMKAYVKNFANATVSCYNELKEYPLVIESFNDAAYPFAKTEDCDMIFCCSSQMIEKFDKDKYFTALNSYKGEKSKLQLTISDIYAPSFVLNKFQIQPLTLNERNDPRKLIQNYSSLLKDVNIL